MHKFLIGIGQGALMAVFVGMCALALVGLVQTIKGNDNAKWVMLTCGMSRAENGSVSEVCAPMAYFPDEKMCKGYQLLNMPLAKPWAYRCAEMGGMYL